jgi:hypothetical protein
LAVCRLMTSSTLVAAGPADPLALHPWHTLRARPQGLGPGGTADTFRGCRAHSSRRSSLGTSVGDARGVLGCQPRGRARDHPRVGDRGSDVWLRSVTGDNALESGPSLLPKPTAR